jgi:hypothetical protein
MRFSGVSHPPEPASGRVAGVEAVEGMTSVSEWVPRLREPAAETVAA